jgi:hypothetical protein
MNVHPLPNNWESQRLLAQRIATHVLGQARFRHDGLFDLVPLPGGFGTPPVGSDRERVRLVGGSIFIERVVGDDVRELTATTQVEMIAANTIRGLCNAIGFDLDPDFWVGNDTPPLGEPDEMIILDSVTSSILGEWYLLGQRAMEEAMASIPGAEASVGRLWPEHFDFGLDLAAKPDVRVNLGAAAGDGGINEPYLYVGPWGPERPGAAEYWTAPFGATLTFAELNIVEEPLDRAIEFFSQGLAYLRE